MKKLGATKPPRRKFFDPERNVGSKDMVRNMQEKYGMRYTPYRGLKGVSMWVRFKFAAMNLKKLAMWKWKNSHNPLFRYKNSMIQKKNLYLLIT